MAREHYGGSVRRELGEDAMHVPLACRVEPVDRLVQHEQPRPGEQRGGKPEPLTHPERKAAHSVVGDVGEPDLLEDLVDSRRPRAGTAQTRQRGEVPPGGQRGVEAGTVNEARDTVGNCLSPPDRRAQDLETAAVRDGQAQQKAEHGGLPRAVRPDHPVNLPGRDIQVNFVERDDITEALRDPACPHHAGSVRNPFSTHTENP